MLAPWTAIDVDDAVKKIDAAVPGCRFEYMDFGCSLRVAMPGASVGYVVFDAWDHIRVDVDLVIANLRKGKEALN